MLAAVFHPDFAVSLVANLIVSFEAFFADSLARFLADAVPVSLTVFFPSFFPASIFLIFALRLVKILLRKSIAPFEVVPVTGFVTVEAIKTLSCTSFPPSN